MNEEPMLVEEIWPIAKLLSPRSTIIVAGAWKGLYLHYLSVRFPDVKVIGFEPQKEAFTETQKRIDKFKLNAEVRNYGLGIADESLMIGQAGSDGASMLSEQSPSTIAEVRDASPVLSDLGLISLFVMNMEGYEYILLPYLIGRKLIRRIEALAVQFHPKYCNIDLRVPLHQHYGDCVYENPDWSYWTCR